MAEVFTTLADKKLISMLKDGAVGVLPTDTVYGLVAGAKHPEAAKKVLLVKGRQYKPGTIIAANTEQLVELGIKARYLKAVEQFWPGAVSIVVPTSLDY